ncbi:MAG: glycerate kinase [Lachnospiraceae bacterium]|nr:glycerate kinase [Lachnospiraceae bacterium]
MKILIMPDSFKGSLSSAEAGESIERGIKKVYSSAQTIMLPFADGGEGTVDALAYGCNGEIYTINVTGPLGIKVLCKYAIIYGNTAIIEMAGAAGLALIRKEERNPVYTTTYGVGEVIRDAVDKGCRKFIIGIGGSATNDGGIGMLQALGFGMENRYGKPVAYGAAGLKELAVIRKENVMPELKECSFKIACDVTNPLCGENGCSAVFGPQKGASPGMVVQMDSWMENYLALAKRAMPLADGNIPGTGAGGGIGFAFVTFLDACLEPGVQLVLQETGFIKHIKTADIIITGEGCLDGQTVMGKAPAGIAKIAKQYNKLVIAFSGSVTDKAADCNKAGIDAFFPVLRSVCTLDEAMDKERAEKNIEDTVEQVFRLIKATGKIC